MRIALELLGLVPGQIGGMETYVRQLLPGLAAANRVDEFLVIVGAEARGITPEAANFRELVVDDLLPGWTRRTRYGKSILQWLAMMRAVRAWKYDLLHCTLNLPRPAWGSPRMVLTLPDLNFEVFPEHWGRVPSRIMSVHTRLGARRARHLFTLSEYAKGEIFTRYAYPPEKISILPLGIDRTIFRESPSVRPLSDIPARYLFFPANTWPHKNHLRAVEAVAMVRDRWSLSCPLVLTGAAKHGHPAFLEAIRKHRIENQIHWLGYVDRLELARLYQNAAALLFPSLHEGFGLPVLEAMACGCPVICSNTTGTIEVAGDACRLVDPANVEALAAAIRELWQNPKVANDHRIRGLERARQYTWENCVATTMAGYRLAMRGLNSHSIASA